MAREIGNYCKAYLLSELRSFPRWQEKPCGTGFDSPGEAEAAEAGLLKDDDVVFVQESYVVTRGIFIDENIVFDSVDGEWIAFCQDMLGFSIPDDVAQAIREQKEQEERVAN